MAAPIIVPDGMFGGAFMVHGLTSGGGAAPTWTPTANPVAQNNGATSVTFSTVAIGSPAASDVIVAVYTSEATVATSLTCNGVAMTKHAQEAASISGLQIYSITATAAGVTSSATTTFVASAGGNMSAEVIQVGKLTGVNATPTNTGTSGTTSIAVTVPSTGFAIVGAFGNSGALSWTNGTQDFTTTIGTEALRMVNATASATVSETGTASIHMVYASWGP